MVTPLLGITELEQNDPTADARVNLALRILEAVAGRLLQSITLSTPPSTPAEGGVWFVATSPTGAWTGKAGKLLAYISGQWHDLGAPKTGSTWDNAATNATIRWGGSSWS
jgi:hypothetical protein